MRVIAGQPLILWALAFFFLGLGFTARIDIPLAILAMTAAAAFAEQPQPSPLLLIRNHWFMAAFLFVALLSTFFSVNPYHSLSVQPQLLPALLCYAIILTFVATEASLRFIVIALMVSGFITAGLVLLNIYLHQVDSSLMQVQLLGSALLIVPNDVLMLSIIAPLVIGVAWTSSFLVRVMALVYFLLTLIVGVLIQSRQGVILLLVGLVMVVALMRPRWTLPLCALAASLSVLVDGLFGWPLLHKIFMFPRAYVWHAAWEMFLDRPWIGQGPGMFKDLYFVFLDRAGYVLAELEDRRTMPWAHSLYLEQLAERGVLGLTALLAMLGVAFQRIVRAWQVATSESMRGLAAGVLAALSVMALAGIAEATLSRLWVTVLLLVLVAFSSVLYRSYNESVR